MLVSLLTAAMLSFAVPAPAGVGDDSLARDSLRLFARDQEVRGAEALATLRELAAEAEQALEGLNDPHDKIQALNRLFFQSWGFRAVQDLRDADNLFLHRVLEERRGYCVGLALAYAAVAEQLGLPVFAVATPRHLFLRYDDGSVRINIETVEGGREIQDDAYRRLYRIAEPAIADGVYLRNLTTKGFLSQVANNLGALRSLQANLKQSQKLYRRALRLDPLNVTARYNRAQDHMRQDLLKQATRGFTRVLELDPGHAEALNNRGVCWAKLERLDLAERDFRAALEIDPASTSARKNLEALKR